MLESSGVATVVRALTSHQCGLGLILRLGVMWIEFVGSLLFSERFFPGYSSGIARIFQWRGGRRSHCVTEATHHVIMMSTSMLCYPQCCIFLGE